MIPPIKLMFAFILVVVLPISCAFHTSSGKGTRKPSSLMLSSRLYMSEGGGLEARSVIQEQLPDPSFLFSEKGNIGAVLDQKWRCGLCSHTQAFEGMAAVRRFKFSGDLLALTMIDGKAVVLRLSTGEVLDRWHRHRNEVTALDFDGDATFVSGGADGRLVRYKCTYDGARKLGDTLFELPDLHTRAVTGVKILGNTIVTTSMDRSLTCLDLDTGSIIWRATALADSPLCMDVDEVAGYIAVGMRSGVVDVYRAIDGALLMSFRAHTGHVRSLHLQSGSVLVTGGGGKDGSVRRWDLSGQSKGVPPPSRIIDAFFYDVLVAQANGAMNSDGHTDCEDEAFLRDLPPGAVRTYRSCIESLTGEGDAFTGGAVADVGTSTGAGKGDIAGARSMESRGRTAAAEPLITGSSGDSAVSAVVAVQGDDEKIAAAYEDGRVVVWDVHTKQPWFELRGRGSLISTVQFDDTRLLADGTHTSVILHDFSVSTNDTAESLDPFHGGSEYRYTRRQDDEDEYEYGGDDDGYPSTTG